MNEYKGVLYADVYIVDITSISIDLFKLWSNGISFMLKLLDESCKTNKCAFI